MNHKATEQFSRKKDVVYRMLTIFAVSRTTTHVILPKTLRRGDAKAETIGFARTSSAYRWSLLLRKERDSNP